MVCMAACLCENIFFEYVPHFYCLSILQVLRHTMLFVSVSYAIQSVSPFLSVNFAALPSISTFTPGMFSDAHLLRKNSAIVVATAFHLLSCFFGFSRL